MQQPDLFQTPRQQAEAVRDRVVAQVADHAGPEFTQAARIFILSYLGKHGHTSGEVLTDACKAAGIVPHDDRAFGGVYQGLSRSGQIRTVGYCPRTKGHLTAGGRIWGLA